MSIEIINLIIGSTSILGLASGMAILIFRTGRIFQRIESLEIKVDEGFRRVDRQFEKIDERFERLEEKIPTINIAITRLEVRLEERTLRTIDCSNKEIQKEVK